MTRNNDRHIDWDSHLKPPDEPKTTECYLCNGDGEREVDCPECDGSLYETCYDCDGEGCDECDDGVVECGECWASGVVIEECYKCEGSGEIEVEDDNE